MPRFVVLVHDHPFVHWDFLLESGDVAKTWRLLESPAHWLFMPAATIVAESIGDHRLEYFDYQGPVCRERGSVARWDHGAAEQLPSSDSVIRLQLTGTRLSGELQLASDADHVLWMVRYSPAIRVVTPACNKGNSANG